MRKMNMMIYFDDRQDKLAVTYKLKMLVRAAVEATLDYEQYANPVDELMGMLGYDHETSEEDEADMRARQRDIMEKLGLSVMEGKA